MKNIILKLTAILFIVGLVAALADPVVISDKESRQVTDTTVIAQAENPLPQERVESDVLRGDGKTTLEPRDLATKKVVGTFIACPLERANTEIDTTLTHPWWSTPQTGRLVNTNVSNVGGRPTLICNYAAYNKTMPVSREVPSRYDSCTAVTGGFRCY